MPAIHILEPHVADLIAAGEVVERPGSVVKELMENAMDAGAKNITVEIRDGGRSLIRVTDDGCGMAPEDAGVAFLRHATSKLRTPADLEAIGTMGFRGEALAAIAAVSRIELLTRTQGAAEGTHMTLEGGDIQEMGPAGAPEGTVIAVRDLFYNTPARLKFLKSDRAEGAWCLSLALRCALGRPEISVRCIRDGKEEFFSPGDGKPESCVYSLLGRDFAAGMLPCLSESEGIRVHGFVSAPRAGRGNRAQQYFFVNGRSIRSTALQAAVEQAYKNTLLTGRFPACVLYVELSCGAVDVNVHPTKNEVKFSQERKVFDAVYYAALGALQAEGPAGETARISALGRAVPVQKADFYQHMTAQEFRARQDGGNAPAAPAASGRVNSPIAPYQIRLDLSGRETARTGGPSAPAAVQRAAPEPVCPAPSPAAAPQPQPHQAEPAVTAEPAEAREETPFRVIGEALDTYILVEQGEALILIDKHAAHERILFDRLQAGKLSAMRQTLLEPVTFSPGAADAELLLSHAGELMELGFEIEAYGFGSVILRAVPADIQGDATVLLEAICEDLRHGRGKDIRDEILHTVACKAAIKAGRGSEAEEMAALAERVLSGEIQYCPHGRPVAVTLTKRELDKQFKRIV